MKNLLSIMLLKLNKLYVMIHKTAQINNELDVSNNDVHGMLYNCRVAVRDYRAFWRNSGVIRLHSSTIDRLNPLTMQGRSYKQPHKKNLGL